MNIYPDWLKNHTWHYTFWIGSQRLDFDALKVFIHIPWHMLLGLIPAWLGFLVYWLSGFSIGSVWVGWTIGLVVGATIMGYQLYWENLFTYPTMPEEMIKERRALILANVIDFFEYALGASTVLFMFLAF